MVQGPQLGPWGPLLGTDPKEKIEMQTCYDASSAASFMARSCRQPPNIRPEKDISTNDGTQAATNPVSGESLKVAA